MSATELGTMQPYPGVDSGIVDIPQLLQRPYGHPSIGNRYIRLGMVGLKLTMFGFGEGEQGQPVVDTFFKNGSFRVPFENDLQLLDFALMWLNQLLHSRGWQSMDEFDARETGFAVYTSDVYIALTELFDDCWRDGRMKEEPLYRRLATRIVTRLRLLDAQLVQDKAMIVQHTAEIDNSPRTIMFMQALNSRKLTGEHRFKQLTDLMFAYYATIYQGEYETHESNEITQLTNVEPWPADVCRAGRAAANKHVRELSVCLAAAKTMHEDWNQAKRVRRTGNDCRECATGKHVLKLKDGCVVGHAHGKKLLEFGPLISVKKKANVWRVFPEGGAGSNFYMGAHVSGSTIGALAKSEEKQSVVQLADRTVDATVLGLPSDEEEAVRYEVSFHPIFKHGNGSATMHLLPDPAKCRLGEAFVVNDILASPDYAGCFALGVNVKKGVDDGVAAQDAVWAVCKGAVEIEKTREKQGQQYMAAGLLKK